MRKLALVLVCATGCTGMSLGEHMPGGDNYVEPDPPAPGEHHMGAIAVEPDEDQLWVVHEATFEDGNTRANLAAIDPVSGEVTEVADVTGVYDRRVMFPANDRMLLMTQSDGRDHLTLFDTDARQAIAQVDAPTWYWGTRTAPSGRAVVVADNADPVHPLHVIDTATLDHQVLQHGGDEIEAMWNHHEDVLLAVSVTQPFSEDASAKLLRYDLRGVDYGAPLPAPSVVWTLDGYDWDDWFSFTWIGISPDDHWAVFPLIKRTAGGADGEHVLLVLDQTNGHVALVPGSGPVGWTRDSQWIVTYGERADGTGEDLWLVDPVTHAQRTVRMPFDGGITYLVSHDTDHVVVTGAWTVVYDVANDAIADTGTALGLYDWVSRPGAGEVWIESGGVHALTLANAAATPVDAGMNVSTINVRPSADQAVVGDGDTARIESIDMATRAVDGDVIALPSPFDGGVAHLAARPPLVQSPFDPDYRISR